MNLFDFTGDLANAINIAISLFYPVIILFIVLFLVACFVIAVLVVFIRFTRNTA